MGIAKAVAIVNTVVIAVSNTLYIILFFVFFVKNWFIQTVLGVNTHILHNGNTP